MRRILPSSDWDKRKHRDDRNSIYWMPNRMYPVPPWIFILGRIEFLVSTSERMHSCSVRQAQVSLRSPSATCQHQ